MKKYLLPAAALALAVLVSGCGSGADSEDGFDVDNLVDKLLSLTDTKLTEAKTAEQLKADLPDELAHVTIDDTVLDSSVTHLSIVDRSTDTTRQTDEVVCEVEVSGEGVYAHYFVQMHYTYTSGGGWGLQSWSLLNDDIHSIQLDIEEGTLTQQLADVTKADLAQMYGESNVQFVDSSWDGDTQICTEDFQVDCKVGTLVTRGISQVQAALTEETSKGLYFSWSVTYNDVNLQHGADIEGTVWYVCGQADTATAELAFRVESMDLENKTAVISAVSNIHEQDSYERVRSLDWDTITWSSDSDGVVTFTIPMGSTTWECCYDTDRQWARLDGSYVEELNQGAADADLSELVDAVYNASSEGMDAPTSYAKSTTSPYYAGDGTLVYQMQVEYPEFSGNYASSLNTIISTKENEFLVKPSVLTDTDSLNTTESKILSAGGVLPLYDQMYITVEYNKNGYLSLLFTTTSCLDGVNQKVSYSSVTYKLDTMEEITEKNLITGSNASVGSVLNTYMKDSPYTGTKVMSHMKAWTLSDEGVVFYIETDENKGTCQKVTVPYSDTVIQLDPTAATTAAEQSAGGAVTG